MKEVDKTGTASGLAKKLRQLGDICAIRRALSLLSNLAASANRDPGRWDEPERFDVNRRAAGHVAFGAGIHLCVGQMLARLETEMLMTALAARVERIDIVGKPQRKLSNSLRQFASMPVELIAAQ
jgi:4-methoxybenzoate monooxygenase (O-demethylating)